jgi:putative IMPACT (imprinted ancient) family translation regulator
MMELSAGKLVVKKSKFYAHLYLIQSPSEMDAIIELHKNKYSNANHHCYAFIFSDSSGDVVKHFQNDSEVGHPGKVLLQLLEQNDYNSHVLMVSRIFGGIKLGVGGVSRAFRKAGSGAITLSKNK